MTDLAELIARVEGATGPDREIDYDLHELQHGDWFVQHGYTRQQDGSYHSPTPPVSGGEHISGPEAYTASIDAALNLLWWFRVGWYYRVGKMTAPKWEHRIDEPYRTAARACGKSIRATRR